MILKKIKSSLKNKKGAGAIEFTINMFIFLMILSLGFELIMVGVKYMQVSDYANKLVRTIAIQGGVDTKVPSGFQGGSSGYKNLNTLVREKNQFAKSVGVDPNDLSVTIIRETSSGSKVSTNIESGTAVRLNYLESFEVKVDYKPKLEVLHNFGQSLNGILRRTKVGLSEYVYDYDA